MTKNPKIIIFDKIYFLGCFLMKVKLFDESHEYDLEVVVNDFLESEDIKILDIKYSVATMFDGKSQIYCFTCMIIYEEMA